MISEVALGRTLASCAEVKFVGGCEREAAKMHCPASCGLCDNLKADDVLRARRQRGGDGYRGFLDPYSSACEDAADEFVKQLSEEALGRTLSSCVEVKIVGGCEHEAAKMHCPQTCGLCGALASQAGAMNRRSLDKCTGT